MKLIISFLAVLILTAAPCVAVPTPAQPHSPVKQPLTEITFAYFPTAVPISVLGETMQRDRILQKNLARQGFQLMFKPFAKGSDVLPLIRDGRIAGVSFSDMPAIEAAATSDMLILGFVKQSYSAVVAPSGTRMHNLRKKRIGNAHGSTSHYALLQALTSAGLSEKDVTLVPLEAHQMLAALERGDVDAFAAWEPTPTAALKKHPGKFVQINRQASYSFFLLSGTLARNNPDVAREISAALVRAIYWLKDSNENLLAASRWAQAGVKNFTGKPSPFNEHDIASVTRNDLLNIAGAPTVPRQLARNGSLLFKEFEFLQRIGKLPADASRGRLEKSFAGALLREVLVAPARYGLNRFDYAK